MTPSQRWKLPVENYECTIKENEGEGEGHGSDVNGTEDVIGTGDEVDEDRQTQTPSQRKRQKKKEERPSRTESGPLDAPWPSLPGGKSNPCGSRSVRASSSRWESSALFRKPNRDSLRARLAALWAARLSQEETGP